jgi:hypothetical protein
MFIKNSQLAKLSLNVASDSVENRLQITLQYFRFIRKFGHGGVEKSKEVWGVWVSCRA